MADLEPVNWGTLKPEARGTRLYAGPEAEQRFPWNCPACGNEQQGRLEDGCQHCGSGKQAAVHVGVDPIVRKADSKPEVLPGLAVRTAESGLEAEARTFQPVVARFAAWFARQHDAATLSAEAVDLLSRGFNAGWAARGPSASVQFSDGNGTSSRVTAELPEIRDEPTPLEHDDSTEPPLRGTARSRTILAALRFFREIVRSAPEEVTTGEWLTLTEYDHLIAEFEESQDL